MGKSGDIEMNYEKIILDEKYNYLFI